MFEVGLNQLFSTMEAIKNMIYDFYATNDVTSSVVITIAIGVLTFFLIMYTFCGGKKAPGLPSVPIGSHKPRFRKRDKVIFYGKKIFRRVHSFAKNSINTQASRRTASNKKKQILRLAKKSCRSLNGVLERKFLQFHKEKQPQLRVREPPPAFLEADWLELEQYEHRLPTEVMYMLRSVRVLGHFEKPIFLELCRFMESRHVAAGTRLFKVGDSDDSIYVVQTGKVNVTITDQDGKEHCVKEVPQGGSIHSLLSILDVLTGHTAAYKTVSAVAEVDSTILRLPAKAFKLVLDRFPESLVRVVQIISVRLQRVTFMALHNYLGLTYELMNPESQSDKSFSIHSINISPNGSPVKAAPDSKTTLSGQDERVTNVTNYTDTDDNVSLGKRRTSGERRVRYLLEALNTKSDGSRSREQFAELKRKSSRRCSEPLGKQRSGSEIEHEPSDFDVACSRARVDMVSEEDPFASGSPPVRSHMEEAGAPHGTPSRHTSKPRVTVNIAAAQEAAQKTSRPNYLDDEQIMNMALQDLVRLFGLENESLLAGKCHLRHIKPDTTLVNQGDQDANLYFVVTGMLQVLQQQIGPQSEETMLFAVVPGELVGTLAVLTGEPSFFTIRANAEARVVTISKHDFYTMMKERPRIVLHLGRALVKRMSPFVRQIDFALDWSMIESGRALFRQGEKSDSIYIILNGRLRSVMTLPCGKKELVGEYGRGELVGIVEVLTQTERATTVIAVRDTELAQIPEELLNLIKRKYPQIVTRLIHLLGQRILGTLKDQRTNVRSILSEHPNTEPRPIVANLATVAVLAASDDVPLSNFTLELQHALNGIGPTLRLTSVIIQHRLGSGALDSVNEYRLSSWLAQQEDIHRMVLYQCDPHMTSWTHHCIRQADCVLIVGLGHKEPTVGKMEKQLESIAMRAQKELILLHREDTTSPKRTVEWLNLRGWCSSHHHVRCPKRIFSSRNPAKTKEVYRRLFEQDADRLSDFSRLARFLTGTAIGLVLGGGGARGLAHVGIIHAMENAGIPIDIIGGTSIGSLIAGIWAGERNVDRTKIKAKGWAKSMTNLWSKILDLTYPVTAMFSGSSFNKSIEAVFGQKQIEDLWLPYFSITTDISASKMRVHTNGMLWRYVRASMSLSGYLPPMCDPTDGHLLLDGGYVNNMPVDVMKMMGVQTVFAVDVGREDETDHTNYGDELSGWWLLWKKWNPWASPVKVPDMAEIQSRLAFVSCVRQWEEVKNSDFLEYIRPPIDKYQTLQFGSFDEIYEVGLHHGKTLFSTWVKKNLVKELFVEKSSDRMKPVMHKSIVPKEANFTDLAELISRIDEPRGSESHRFLQLDDNDDDDDDDEDEDDNMSVISEPPVSINSFNNDRRGRHVSEGASLSSTPTDEMRDFGSVSQDDTSDDDETFEAENGNQTD